MNTSTVNTLNTLIRARLNITNLNTVSDAEMKLFIRSSLAQLYEKIANRHRDMYVVDFTFSLIKNVDTYSLPADFRSMEQVWLTFGTAPNVQRLPLEQFTWPRYQSQLSANLLQPQWPTMYRVVGPNIRLAPLPGSSFTNAIQILYIPQWQAPANDDATIGNTLPNGWERWVEYDVCTQVAMRMRLPEYYAMYTKERDKEEATLIEGASIRDASPAYMIDAFDVPWFGLNRPGEG